MYYAPSDELIMLQGNELSPEEVEERNQDVSNRFRASASVLRPGLLEIPVRG